MVRQTTVRVLIRHPENDKLAEMSSQESVTDVSLDSVITRNTAIIFTDLDDTVVMMDVDKGVYFELDPIATRIWTLLGTAGRPVTEVCDALVEEYDVTPDACRRDVLGFLAEARELGIVEPISDRSTSP